MALTYKYGIRNQFVPAALAPNAYGWKSGNSYNSADVPSRWVTQASSQVAVPSDVLRQQFAYEWFQSGDINAGWSPNANMSNPPFVSGAAGRLIPLLTDALTGGPSRILRGYIRRANYDVKDDLSKTRLYFMYNPEQISRDYISYLDSSQTALDPFNTVYQSGNLVAPPSMLSFSFSLFFDRQEEAQQFDHPGVFVDYQYFDMVVRNVIPTDPNQMSNTLPDNGVMMVNPMDITVIFSPQITVQGRPTNASVQFIKFTNRMVPTRMVINLTMLATYFGPVKDQVEYSEPNFVQEDTVPVQKAIDQNYSFGDIEAAAAGNATADAATGYTGQVAQSGDANQKIRIDAMNWALNHIVQGGPGAGLYYGGGFWTDYTSDNNARTSLPRAADCSGLVTKSYNNPDVNMGATLKWTGYPGTTQMAQIARANPSLFTLIPVANSAWQSKLLPGDLALRTGHPIHRFRGSRRLLPGVREPRLR